jgi:hypothetical protein
MSDVLVVRPGALGDTILTLPLLRTIRSLKPGAAITFLGTSAYRMLIPPGVAFQGVDAARWAPFFQDDPPADGLPNMAGATAFVILSQGDVLAANLLRSGVADVRMTASVPVPGIHVVEHMHRGLGLACPSPAPDLAHLRPRERNHCIWLHPGSGGPGKCLPLPDLVHLVEAIMGWFGLSLVVTLGEADRFVTGHPEWRPFLQRTQARVLERASLEDVCAVAGSAALYVGNDSGISHLAAGMGIPSLVVYVRTDPRQWAPWVRSEQCALMEYRSLNTQYPVAAQCRQRVERLLGMSIHAERKSGSQDPATRHEASVS